MIEIGVDRPSDSFKVGSKFEPNQKIGCPKPINKLSKIKEKRMFIFWFRTSEFLVRFKVASDFEGV